MSTPDFSVANHGSILILHALTDAAREWVDENIGDDAMTWGTNGHRRRAALHRGHRRRHTRSWSGGLINVSAIRPPRITRLPPRYTH